MRDDVAALRMEKMAEVLVLWKQDSILMRGGCRLSWEGLRTWRKRRGSGDGSAGGRMCG